MIWCLQAKKWQQENSTCLLQEQKTFACTVIPNLQCLLPVWGDSIPRATMQCLEPMTQWRSTQTGEHCPMPPSIHCFSLNISGLTTLRNLLLLLDFPTPMFTYMTLIEASNFWNRRSSKLIKIPLTKNTLIFCWKIKGNFKWKKKKTKQNTALNNTWVNKWNDL